MEKEKINSEKILELLRQMDTTLGKTDSKLDEDLEGMDKGFDRIDKKLNDLTERVSEMAKLPSDKPNNLI
ncbi:hypothetical protein OR571_16000 [Psychrobacillus sp. NEAU-3TGS]|uniref:hypothetical protein n=1 Tax=Psychrobacillus sp. NEAU-3TGS TaxID=2995412 RepID=UPI0024977C0E|nr:hypothetical protein [Psychrobacillus sp. NEAU-3TGS]MDI2588572.1 hypothetical protein [Psychrobacillus sp. NEAU-3TGS]